MAKLHLDRMCCQFYATLPVERVDQTSQVMRQTARRVVVKIPPWVDNDASYDEVSM